MNPQLILAAAIAAASFGAGWTINGWRHDAAKSAQLEHQAERQADNAATADIAAEKHEADKAGAEQHFRTITVEVEKIVEKPVYHNVCFDDDGLRVLRAAIAGDSPAAGKPAAAVPGLKPPDGRNGGGGLTLGH